MKKTISLVSLICLSLLCMLFIEAQKNGNTLNIVYLHEHTNNNPSTALDVLNELNKSGNVVLKFYADWCGPCRRMSPLIDSVAQTMPQCTFIYIDRDQFPHLAKHFGITSIPTLIFLHNGVVIGRYDDKPLSQKELTQFITTMFGNN